MNVYLLLALAFGAFTGAADVRVPRAAVTITVRMKKRAQWSAAALGGVFRTRRGGPRRSTETAVCTTILEILSATLSPRAPAVTC